MEKFETLNELILALMLWITSNTNYIEPKQVPQVEFIEQEKLSEIACKNRSCEIMAYTPLTPKYKIYLSNELKPMTDVCHRAILMHEIIHVIQEDQNIFLEYDERTKKHLREMDALVNHNIFLSRYGKKILYSNGFAAKFKTKEKNTLYC
ncbi:MAG: hypothetical protein CMP42_00575 [Rickettsiales bacterium]|jgi:hypothetical protein|nr:hypothetical protein [Rickettsiales bacterium]|tara:strand:- start:330 stop:779 length:450 start_codon:yes stop_codon:yes gene_type:complete